MYYFVFKVYVAASITMWVVPMAVITLFIRCVLGTDIDVTVNLICEFITENKLKTAIAMTCWKKTGSCINDKPVGINLRNAND
jgi:hypothetical protein